MPNQKDLFLYYLEEEEHLDYHFLQISFLHQYHLLQGFWYRFLVDVKVHELETLMRAQGLTLEEAVRREFGYEI